MGEGGLKEGGGGGEGQGGRGGEVPLEEDQAVILVAILMHMALVTPIVPGECSMIDRIGDAHLSTILAFAVAGSGGRNGGAGTGDNSNGGSADEDDGTDDGGYGTDDARSSSDGTSGRRVGHGYRVDAALSLIKADGGGQAILNRLRPYLLLTIWGLAHHPRLRARLGRMKGVETLVKVRRRILKYIFY